MGCEMKSTVIDGRKYTVVQMTATKALELEARYGLILGEAFQAVAGVDASELRGNNVDALVGAAGRALGFIRKAIEPAELAALIRDFCSQVACDGKPVDFDAHYSGPAGVALRYRVFWFVLEANYGGFIDALGLSAVLQRLAPTGGNEAPTQ